MEIRLRPELEALIRQDRKAEIEAQIAEGYASAQRGDLIDADEVRSRLDQRKRTHLADQSRG